MASPTKPEKRSIFVSYPQAENHSCGKYPNGDPIEGWVDVLLSNLEFRLGQLGWREGTLEFWTDHQASGIDSLSEQIREQIRTCSLFLAVTSPAYYASDWCINRELPQFLQQECKGRIAVVEKHPFDGANPGAPPAHLPAFLQEDQLRYQFWKVRDRDKRIVTFGEPVPKTPSDEEYQEILLRLVQDINAKLRETQPLTAASPRPAVVLTPGPTGGTEAPLAKEGPAIFLAQTTSSDQLRKAREETKSFLLQANIRVIEPSLMPGEESAYRAEMVRLLNVPGVIFAQLLDEAPGPTLDDAKTRIIQLQWEVARNQRLPIVQLHIPALEVGKADPATAEMLNASTVQRGTVTEFCNTLVGKAKAQPVRVVVSRDAVQDDSLANSITQTLQRREVRCGVAALNESTAALKTQLSECEALIVVHGHSSLEALRRHVESCLKILRGRIQDMPKLVLLQGPPMPKEGDLNFLDEEAEVINCQGGYSEKKLSSFLSSLPPKQA
jgi:hypothetical protein